ncbi:hypothetical protein PMIN04_003256 [Paraphaeosphaeria minitans]
MSHTLLTERSLIVAGAAMALFIIYQAFLSLKPRPKSLQISEIYVYPIKSLRPTKLKSALATRYGFQHDRVFMLLQVVPDGYKNMAVSRYPDMTQFVTSIEHRKDGQVVVNVTFRAFGSEEKSKTLSVPLTPETEKLDPFNVDMHGSPTAAFKMPNEYNAWFSACFGYEVVLVHLGKNKREVLWTDLVQPKNASLLAQVPVLGAAVPQTPKITFADCAPYLVVSSTSLDNVSSRLAPGEPMDVTKFRPNIVLSGADEAWDEDYWSKVRIGSVDLIMKHNCVRCASVNVDYETGKPGTGESGQVLKKLQKDRRVDKGAKWSPVFGRYAFRRGRDNGQIFKVGDKAVVTDRSKDRTIFSKLQCSEYSKYIVFTFLDWPGIG